MRYLAALCLLLLQTGTDGFDIFDGASLNHQEITESAILATTLQACASLAKAEGKDFEFPSTPQFAASVLAACDAIKSAKTFASAIEEIQDENQGVDKKYFWSSGHHFDAEEFVKGRKLVTDGLSVVKASNKKRNFESARERLGQLFHPLQDFYSHSNWVEMGNTKPNANLIKVKGSIGKTAAPTRATCQNCDGDDCTNNILADILRDKILTTGYFSLTSSDKPAGKCSHGGGWDKTRKTEPTGGINKDTLESEHKHLHNKAALVAIAATSQALEDVRAAAGDRDFLKMMGINKGKALCFVIDTTGSMGDDIATVRTVTSRIINSKVGTEDEPSLYILVPFNDPDFGPLTKTTDPEAFKNAINALRATGGGDYPEMCLSGLRLALTGAPPGSEIYVFTDATAKDEHLKGAVIALIEKTKSTVNFLLTGGLGLRRRRQSDNDPQQQNVVMTRATTQLYTDLAQTSGGQAIRVSKSQLLEATSIISESSAASLVILLQASRNPGKADNFTFLVDETVKNLTIYMTGTGSTFNLISPSGVSQDSATTTGPLIVSSQTVGNFKTVQLNAEVGEWEIRMMSTNPYNLKVVGDSRIDFLFTFMELSNSPFGGYDPIGSRPRAGVNGTLRITVTGDTSATVTDVTLVESTSSAVVNGSVDRQGDGRFLVHLDRIPTNDFVVLVKGKTGISSTRASSSFQRQSATSTRASTVTVTADLADTVIEPGVAVSVPFTVATGGAGGSFTVEASNDQGFPLTFPSTLSLASGGSANGTVNLTAPAGTASGTDVTLTIQANNPGGTDTNFAVLRLAVLTTVTDFTEPTCELLNLQSNCSSTCNMSVWDLSLQVTDGPNGTGISSITYRQGVGSLSVNSSAGNITLVSYNASCCSPDVEIVVVDEVGNVGICSYSVRADTGNATTAPPTTTPMTTQTQTTSAAGSLTVSALWVFLLCLSTTILVLRS